MFFFYRTKGRAGFDKQGFGSLAEPCYKLVSGLLAIDSEGREPIDTARGWATFSQVIVNFPLKNTTFQLFGGNMGYMSVKD